MDPPDLIWFAGADYDPGSGYNGRQRGYGELDDGRFDAVVESDRACGSAMLIPRAVLKEVGDFDAELFAYCEDSDFPCGRARRLPALRRSRQPGLAQGFGRLRRGGLPVDALLRVRNAIELAER